MNLHLKNGGENSLTKTLQMLEIGMIDIGRLEIFSRMAIKKVGNSMKGP